jgi:glycosyltransferase involved in cell wall biosynthesis
VGEILAGLDMVVVPSIWYENSPLTIQEAFIARVPVITANEGGMAELVRDGIDGLHFRLGDAADLRRKLRYVATHPDVLERLRDGIPAVPGIEAHAATLLGRYRTLWANRTAVPRQP